MASPLSVAAVSSEFVGDRGPSISFSLTMVSPVIARAGAMRRLGYRLTRNKNTAQNSRKAELLGADEKRKNDQFDILE
jgi:hypothetical protein